jgi:hypothetical protein
MELFMTLDYRKKWLDEGLTRQQGIDAVAQRTAASKPVSGPRRPSPLEEYFRLVGQAELNNGEMLQQASRQIFGDPTYGGSRNPYTILSEGKELPGHNDMGDAVRHAETSRRLSAAIGVPAAFTLGTIREILERWQHNQPRGEMTMDLHNNREGRRAYQEDRPVNPRNLQTLPGVPTPFSPYSGY